MNNNIIVHNKKILKRLSLHFNTEPEPKKIKLTKNEDVTTFKNDEEEYKYILSIYKTKKYNKYLNENNSNFRINDEYISYKGSFYYNIGVDFATLDDASNNEYEIDNDDDLISSHYLNSIRGLRFNENAKLEFYSIM